MRTVVARLRTNLRLDATTREGKSHLETAPYRTLFFFLAILLTKKRKQKTLEGLILQAFQGLVPGAGIEPAQPFDYWFLSPARPCEFTQILIFDRALWCIMRHYRTLKSHLTYPIRA